MLFISKSMRQIQIAILPLHLSALNGDRHHRIVWDDNFLNADNDERNEEEDEEPSSHSEPNVWRLSGGERELSSSLMRVFRFAAWTGDDEEAKRRFRANPDQILSIENERKVLKVRNLKC